MTVYLTILILLSIIAIKCESNHELRIGGLFRDEEEKLAFNVAVHLLNRKYSQSPFRLSAHGVLVQHYNAFNIHLNTCSMLQKGLVGVFGPSSRHSSAFITSILDRKEMPHIESHCNLKLTRTNCLLNVHPHPSILSHALVELVMSFNWRKLVILYDSEESFSKIGPILENYANYDRSVTMKHLEKDEDGSFRHLLTAIKKSGETNFVLDCTIDVLSDILKQAQQVGMMTEKYNYVITNLDLQSIDLSQFQYSDANITGLRIVDPTNPNVIAITKKIYKTKIENGFTEKSQMILPVNIALIIDAVQLLYEALMDFTNTSTLLLNPIPLHCNINDNWKNGQTIINYMRGKSIYGLTGIVKFDLEGFRRDFTLDLMELIPSGLRKIGSWAPNVGLNITHRRTVEMVTADEGSLVNKTFNVITCLTPPYAMYKEETSQLRGNDRFEGFGIDLIEELSQMLKFNYTILIQEDGSNGIQDPITKEWTGLIGDIIRENADLAIADLTVTSDREKYVDFTPQFMALGIKILYKKPEPEPPSLFLFLSPFSIGVWILLGVSYFFVSFALFVMGRLSPSEWTNPYPCIEEPEFLINQFSIRNSFWFTMGSLMQQGSEIAPIAISTRTAAGMWWFFILIMGSSYTANLAAFLTVETLVTSFNNLEELAAQTEIKYGAKRDGATANYFKNSEEGTIRHKIWEYMVHHDSEVMTKDNEEGVQWVEEGKYAYFMESTSIDYVVERHCTLASVGSALDEKGYAIAMKKNSPYRHTLSTAILKLQETGKISKIQEKWWKEKCGAGRCEKKDPPEAQPLSLKNVGGVFLVLFVGSFFGLLSSFCEMGIYYFRKSKDTEMKIKEELQKEMKFFVKFKHNVKPVGVESSENKLL